MDVSEFTGRTEERRKLGHHSHRIDWGAWHHGWLKDAHGARRCLATGVMRPNGPSGVDWSRALRNLTADGRSPYGWTLKRRVLWTISTQKPLNPFSSAGNEDAIAGTFCAGANGASTEGDGASWADVKSKHRIRKKLWQVSSAEQAQTLRNANWTSRDRWEDPNPPWSARERRSSWTWRAAWNNEKESGNWRVRGFLAQSRR